MSLPADLESKKARASAWFTELRDSITAALERIEDDLPASVANGDAEPGRAGPDSDEACLAFPSLVDLARASARRPAWRRPTELAYAMPTR